MAKKSSNKNSREYLNKQISGARASLLMILIFTAVNLLMLVTDAGRYFLFSAAVPYYLTAFGMGMDIGAGYSGVGTFTTTALVISAVILAVYLVCWLMSKKKTGWLTAALVLFALDTLVLLVIAVRLDALGSSILDLLFHVWALVEMVQAVQAGGKLKKMPKNTVNSGDPFDGIPALDEDTEAFY